MIDTVSNWKSEASEDGANYLSRAFDLIDQSYPAASQGEKAIAAASLAQTMAISALVYAVSGQAGNSPLGHALARYVGEEL